MMRALLLGLPLTVLSFTALAQDAQQVVSGVAQSTASPVEQSVSAVDRSVNGDQPARAQQIVPEVTPAVPATPEQASTVEGQAESEAPSAVEKEINEQLSFQKPPVDPNTMSSLFFTVWEHDLLLDARQGMVSRAPDAPDDGVDPMNVFPPAIVGPRDIGLGGIVYRGKKDWVIWINSVRISPDAIPTEVMDLKVYKDYIELEWFDQSTRQIYPIRLRPHQRFNLDTRMFLPG